MIDYLNTKIIISEMDIPWNVFNHIKEPFFWHGLEFYPIDEYSFRATKNSLKNLHLDNLNIVFRNGQAATLYISNSLHKLFNNGINYTDFTKSNLKSTINFVSKKLGIDFLNASLFGKLEVGVNIQLENPENYLSLCMKYKNILPEPMRKGNKIYGIKYPLATYALKIYSPAKKLKLEKYKSFDKFKKTIRFEIVTNISYLRKRGIRLYNIKDLLDGEILHLLGTFLLNAAKDIKLRPKLRFKEINYIERYILCYFNTSSREELTFFRKKNKSTYYRHHKIHKSILEKFNDCDIGISERINEKWLFLESS